MLGNPIQKALSEQEWTSLGKSVRSHYDINSPQVISGYMDEVWHSRVAGVFIFFSRFLGALIPYQGKNIPTTVYHEVSNGSFKFERTLSFPGKNPIKFPSRMVYSAPNEVIEYVALGIGIRMSLTAEDTKLVYRLKDYVWNLGLFKLHIPNFFLLGGGSIIETPIDEGTFRVDFEMHHPIYGRTFYYGGNFSAKKD